MKGSPVGEGIKARWNSSGGERYAIVYEGRRTRRRNMCESDGSTGTKMKLKEFSRERDPRSSD